MTPITDFPQVVADMTLEVQGRRALMYPAAVRRALEEAYRAGEATGRSIAEEALDMIAEAFVEPSCDGKDGLSDGMNCISCRAVELLRKAGRRP
jgi:hypothetical protein